MELSGPGPLPADSAANVRSSVNSSAVRSISNWLILRAKSPDWISGLPSTSSSLAMATEFLHAALRPGNARIARTFVGEEELGTGPAFVFLADKIANRHAHVRQPCFVHLMAAVESA